MREISQSVGESLVAVEFIRSVRLRNHESGVRRLCAAFCIAVGYGQGEAEMIGFAAGLHDVGKLTISDKILEKPGKLDPEEWVIVQRHTLSGHAILSTAQDSDMDLAAIAARHHHEHWDGSGYPDGLAGEAIPRVARIVGLCDVYDALRETRSYKPPYTHEEVVRMILEGDSSGRMKPSMFDPDMLQVFESSQEELRRIYDERPH
jgi:putative two-component system response regulator